MIINYYGFGNRVIEDLYNIFWCFMVKTNNSKIRSRNSKTRPNYLTTRSAQK